MTMFPRVRLPGAATMLAALALATTALPTVAAPNGDISVTGGSEAVLEVSIADSSAAFPADMKPDGVHTDAEEAGDWNAAAGHCYWWDGADNLTVRSNVTYDLSVGVTSGGSARLLFTAGSAPTNYAECVSGEPVVGGMAGANLVGDGVTATAGDQYDTHFTVSVPWTAAPFTIASTVTFTASAAS